MLARRVCGNGANLAGAWDSRERRFLLPRSPPNHVVPRIEGWCLPTPALVEKEVITIETVPISLNLAPFVSVVVSSWHGEQPQAGFRSPKFGEAASSMA